MGRRSRTVRLALCALLIGTASAWALTPHDKAVGVQAERHAQNGIQTQQNTSGEPQKAAETAPVVPSVHTPSENGEEQPKAQQGADEGTEFWPPLYGYRVKVTDSIIAIFTALLFGATLALWWSTRSLVKGADEASKRQLRAYVGIENGHIACEFIANELRAKPVLRIKNVEQTPAYNVTSSIGIAESESFSEQIDAKKITIEGNTYIFPGGSHRLMGFNADLKLPAPEKIKIYVFGHIEYDDIFSKKRTTRFRFFVRNIDLASRKGELAPCNDGNFAD